MATKAIGRTLGMKHYESSNLFAIARRSYESIPSSQADRAPLSSDAPYVCLVFSATAFEAFLNELYDDIIHPDRHHLEAVHARPVFSRFRMLERKEWNHPKPKSIPRPAWNSSVLRKGFISRHFADEPVFSNLCRLIRLRNWLIHHEPFKLGIDLTGAFPKEITDLASDKILTYLPIRTLSPHILICNRAIMRWELNTISNMVRYLAKCIPAGPIYRSNFMQLDVKWPIIPDPSNQEGTSVS